jgi:hypothetical protein
MQQFHATEAAFRTVLVLFNLLAEFQRAAGLSGYRPRGTPENRPMRDTSKPANEREARQALLYPASGAAGKSFFLA